VSADTVEYNDIAQLFFATMSELNADIVHIHRLQNPVLWQFYAVSVLSLCLIALIVYCCDRYRELIHRTLAFSTSGICVNWVGCYAILVAVVHVCV